MPISLSNISNINHPGYISGRYYLYSPFIRDYSTSVSGLGLASITYIPFYISKKIKITRLALFCAGTVTNGGARIGIYSNNDGFPANLLVDAGNLVVASFGAKEAIVDISLSEGYYWFAGTAVGAVPYLYSALYSTGNIHFLGQASPGAQGNEAVWGMRNTSSGSLYTSLPPTAPINNLSYIAASSAPLMWYKIG
jgi:hypothetical protein